MRAVIRAVDGERLALGVGAIGAGNVDDSDRLLADEERDAVGFGRRCDAQDDRNREGPARVEATGCDNGCIVVRPHERIQRGEPAGREHEQVRQLPLAHLEPWQSMGFGDERMKLVAFGQSLDHPPRQMAETLERVQHLRQGLVCRLARRVTNHLRVQRLLVGIAYAGEIGDLARERLPVQAFDVALGQGLDRATHVDLDEFRGLRSHLVANLAIG